MSRWAHIAGMIRFDSIPGHNYKRITYKTFEPYFGKPLDWQEADEHWCEIEKHPEKYVPYGTEGGLEYKIIKNERVSWLEVILLFYGDLRDWEDPLQKIIDWFKISIEKISRDCIIRQATITADDGFEDVVNWSCGNMFNPPKRNKKQ